MTHEEYLRSLGIDPEEYAENRGKYTWPANEPRQGVYFDRPLTAYTPEGELKKKPKPDMVNHPPHYTKGGIECIDAIEAAVAGLEGPEAVYTAHALRYTWRWKHKNGLEDVEKAIWYLQRLADRLRRS